MMEHFAHLNGTLGHSAAASRSFSDRRFFVAPPTAPTPAPIAAPFSCISPDRAADGPDSRPSPRRGRRHFLPAEDPRESQVC